MSDFKGKLSEAYDALCELENEARGLRNQNLADQIGHAIGRMKMAISHPDVDRVGTDDPDHSAGPVDPLNSGGNLKFAATDPGRELQDAEQARRAAFDHDAANRDPVTGQPLAPFPGTEAKPYVAPENGA